MKTTDEILDGICEAHQTVQGLRWAIAEGCAELAFEHGWTPRQIGEELSARGIRNSRGNTYEWNAIDLMIKAGRAAREIPDVVGKFGTSTVGRAWQDGARTLAEIEEKIEQKNAAQRTAAKVRQTLTRLAPDEAATLFAETVPLSTIATAAVQSRSANALKDLKRLVDAEAKAAAADETDPFDWDAPEPPSISTRDAAMNALRLAVPSLERAAILATKAIEDGEFTEDDRNEFIEAATILMRSAKADYIIM